MKYIFGPVHSWRLGRSLGIDPISTSDKICSMNCVYCQVGETSVYSHERKEYVATRDVIDEIKSLSLIDIDYLTFSSNGEPTLAKNLGDMIEELRTIRKERIAVITNSTLMYREDVQKDLCLADFVLAKLDACDQETLSTVNRAMESISFSRVVDGIRNFRQKFDGKLDLQIMFVDTNRKYAKEIAGIARDIAPDEIEINTPLRPSGVKPLTRESLDEIKKCFEGLPAKTVYEMARKTIDPIHMEDTIKRHGICRDL